MRPRGPRRASFVLSGANVSEVLPRGKGRGAGRAARQNACVQSGAVVALWGELPGSGETVRQREVFEAIQRLDRTGEPAVLATIVRVRGSSPGSVGSKMLITARGEAVG